MIVNEHPVSYLDEMQAQLTAVLDDGPWSAWQHRPGGAYLLRADRMGHAERVLLEAVAARGAARRPRRPADAARRGPTPSEPPDAPLVPTSPPRGDTAAADAARAGA